MAQGLSGGCAGVPVRPAADRIVTVSRIPRAAVAASRTEYGPWKPDAEACGADAAPIINAAQAAQRWPARHPCAAVMLSAAAPISAATRPTAGPGWRDVVRTMPQRARSSAAVASRMAAISRGPVRLPAADDVVPPSAAAAAGTAV